MSRLVCFLVVFQFIALLVSAACTNNTNFSIDSTTPASVSRNVLPANLTISVQLCNFTNTTDITSVAFASGGLTNLTFSVDRNNSIVNIKTGGYNYTTPLVASSCPTISYKDNSNNKTGTLTTSTQCVAFPPNTLTVSPNSTRFYVGQSVSVFTNTLNGTALIVNYYSGNNFSANATGTWISKSELSFVFPASSSFYSPFSFRVYQDGQLAAQQTDVFSVNLPASGSCISNPDATLFLETGSNVPAVSGSGATPFSFTGCNLDNVTAASIYSIPCDSVTNAKDKNLNVFYLACSLNLTYANVVYNSFARSVLLTGNNVSKSFQPASLMSLVPSTVSALAPSVVLFSAAATSTYNATVYATTAQLASLSMSLVTAQLKSVALTVVNVTAKSSTEQIVVFRPNGTFASPGAGKVEQYMLQGQLTCTNSTVPPCVPAAPGTSTVLILSSNATSLTVTGEDLPPTIVAVSPATAPIDYSTLITVNGTGLLQINSASLGALPISNLTKVSNSQLTFMTGSCAAGTNCSQAVNTAVSLVLSFGVNSTVTYAGFSYTYDKSPALATSLRFNLSYNKVVNNATERAAFEAGVQSALAAALAVPARRVSIGALTEGSIITQVILVPNPGNVAPTSETLFANLIKQLNDSSSPLRNTSGSVFSSIDPTYNSTNSTVYQCGPELFLSVCPAGGDDDRDYTFLIALFSALGGAILIAIIIFCCVKNRSSGGTLLDDGADKSAAYSQHASYGSGNAYRND